MVGATVVDHASKAGVVAYMSDVMFRALMISAMVVDSTEFAAAAASAASSRGDFFFSSTVAGKMLPNPPKVSDKKNGRSNVI